MGFSLSVVNSLGTSKPLLFGYGADVVYKKNSIETTFGRLKEISHDILEFYKNEVGKLGFFEQTQSSNYKWQLTSESTDEEMRMFLAVIQDVADKIIDELKL